MTPLEKMNPTTSAAGKLVLAPKWCNNVTQRELNEFKDWAKKNGWEIKPTYRGESQKRAFTLTKGPYTVMGINRTTTEETETNPRGHHRGDHSVIIECSLSCFIHGHNLGQYGIHWGDFMSEDVELLVMLRVPKQFQSHVVKNHNIH